MNIVSFFRLIIILTGLRVVMNFELAEICTDMFINAYEKNVQIFI
jgi:hypothetical protein